MDEKRLEDLYREEEKIRDEMKSLFLRYLEVSKKILESKKEAGLPPMDRSRQKALRKAIHEDKDILVRKYFQPVNEALMGASSAYQLDIQNSPEIREKTIRIAYFGTGPSNTYLSLTKMLEKKGYRFINQYSLYKNQTEIELFGTTSIRDLEHKLVTGEVEYAFVPYVNSNTGVVMDTYHLMRDVRFRFEDIFVDYIVLYLYIAKRNADKIADFNDIETIYTNIPALNQCSDFVNAYTPFATYRKSSSTTQSIDAMLSDTAHLAACFANERADENEQLVRFREKTTSNNNGTYTKYLLISLPHDHSLRKKQEDLRDYFVGYYLYTSERKQGQAHSVDAKSYRAVEVVKDEKGELHMSVFTFGNKTQKISHSTHVEVKYDDQTRHIVLTYDYAGESEKSTVRGHAYLQAKESALRDPSRRIHGEYFGLNNGKSGTLEYRRITKKEFDLLTE